LSSQLQYANVIIGSFPTPTTDDHSSSFDLQERDSEKTRQESTQTNRQQQQQQQQNAEDFDVEAIDLLLDHEKEDLESNTNDPIKQKKQNKPTSYQLDDLEQVTLPHGNFFYGPHSQEINIPENEKMEYTWNEEQKFWIEDEEINIVRERERCARYKFQFDENRKTRRRLFLGFPITADSIEVVKAVGAESFNIFHTVAYLEFNVTHTLNTRRLRFNESSQELFQLMQAFGSKTKVSMDYYALASSAINQTFGQDGLGVERVQHESMTLRWKRNGMRPDDIGIRADADETFTRDFLRAIQFCDIPEFRPNQSCQKKIIAHTVVFEGSPECQTKGRTWWHPDAILGECIHRIGNETLHPPTLREWRGKHSIREKGYGRLGNFSLYKPNPTGSESGTFPLWHSSDIRTEVGGRMVHQDNGGHTGYHFHNYFKNAEHIHYKYLTYGHPRAGAMEMPIWDIDTGTFL
jgi:hypothetical protein